MGNGASAMSPMKRQYPSCSVRSLREAGTRLLCLSYLLLPAIGVAADYPPMDHGGSDLVLTDGDVIWGEHRNVGHFEIPAVATVNVHRYYPEVPWSGRLDVYADDIVISGTLTAEGAGYTGGGGAGGLGATGSLPEYDGDDGANGNPRYYGYLGSEVWPNRGDGQFGGKPHHTNQSTRNGGYNSLNANTDTTTDTSVLIGSGGAGGYPTLPLNNPPGLCLFEPVGGAGGNAGGPGGGCVRLFSTSSLHVAGRVLATGAFGGAGNFGETGSINNHVSPCISIGGDGGDAGDSDDLNGSSTDVGSGAGGGVLVLCGAPGEIQVTGTIDTRSSEWRFGRVDDGIRNGGTVKVFFTGDLESSGTLKGGRIYLRDLDDEPLSPVEPILRKVYNYNPPSFDLNQDTIVDAADIQTEGLSSP